MGWWRPAAVMIAAIAIAPMASAQGDAAQCDAAEQTAQTEEFDKLRPFAGAVRAPGFVYSIEGPNCLIVTFYRMPANPSRPSTRADVREAYRTFVGRAAKPFFAARYIDDSKSFPYQPRWTDETRCPALLTALENLELVLAPKIVGDGPYRHGSTSISDQPVIRFWMSGQVYPQDDVDFTLSYQLKGGSGAPFGKWLFDTFKALKPCWSEEAPIVP